MQHIANEMLQVVAEYDGWVKKSEIHPLNGSYYAKEIKEQSKVVSLTLFDFEYDISMDWLHPVAMKVIDVLCVNTLSAGMGSRIKYKKLVKAIESALICRPINGQYIDLFNAVHEAISFINQNKQTDT